jgi:hypothetical protein
MTRSRMTLPASAAIPLPALVLAVGGQASSQPVAYAAAASCDDHPNQASAQRAKDTRDADGDGIYCVIYSG